LTLHFRRLIPRRFLFATVLAVDADGKERELTRGWLRASQRHVREGSARLGTGARPRGARAARAGEDLPGLDSDRADGAAFPRRRGASRYAVKGADDEPAQTSLEAIARNHLRRPRPARITLHCDESHPSRHRSPCDALATSSARFFSGGDVSSFGLSR
jgi:hypothetical protein